MGSGAFRSPAAAPVGSGSTEAPHAASALEPFTNEGATAEALHTPRRDLLPEAGVGGSSSSGSSGGAGAAATGPVVATDLADEDYEASAGECANSDGAYAGAVWLSLDPRTGDLHPYPFVVAQRLEAAFGDGGGDAGGRRRAVALTGLGGCFEGAAVEMGGGEPPLQRTSRGKRDVRRVEVFAGCPVISLDVAQGRTWRIVDYPVPGVTQERVIKVSGAELVGFDGGDACAAWSRERIDTIARGDAAGLVALWEWCRDPDTKDPDSLPMESWGIYSEEQNGSIDSAFREGKHDVPVCIGIRNYDIVFCGADAAKQVDRTLNKRRYVRRRLLSPDERDAVFRAAAEAFAASSTDAAYGECAVCCADFAETPMVPFLILPECGHSFHCACIQEIADRKDPCPLCRTDVDWDAALRASMGPLTDDGSE